jgi:phage terminase small subunit
VVSSFSSSEFKQALEAESGKTLEQIKQETDFNTNKNIPEAPVWVDDALAQKYFTEYNRKIATSYHTQPNFLPKQKNSSGN